jgi:hypothetical protein
MRDMLLSLRSRAHKRIAGASSAAGVFNKHPPTDQILNVAGRRILRTFLDLGPFAGGQLAVEAFQQAVQHVALAGIERCVVVGLPEARLVQDVAQDPVGSVKGAI